MSCPGSVVIVFWGLYQNGLDSFPDQLQSPDKVPGQLQSQDNYNLVLYAQYKMYCTVQANCTVIVTWVTYILFMGQSCADRITI